MTSIIQRPAVWWACN